MARIKVTGYIETDNLPEEFLDDTSDDGLTNAGYEALMGIRQVEGRENEGNLALRHLDDIEFEKED